LKKKITTDTEIVNIILYVIYAFGK